MFECSRCGYKTSRKHNLTAHLQRRVPCDPVVNDVDPKIQLNELTTKEKLFLCSYCSEHFSSLSTKYRHQSSCPANYKFTPAKCTQHSTPPTTTTPNIIQSLQNRIKSLELHNEALKSNRKESFYQAILEDYYKCTHAKYKTCQTDLTNETFHAEIKRWDCYKEAIGQLLTANVIDTRPKLHAYLFGKYNNKKEATDIMQKMGIIVYEFYDSNSDVYVRNLNSDELLKIYTSQND